jgi:hypothetical protein
MIFWAVRNCAGHSSEVINRFLEEVLPRTRGFTGLLVVGDLGVDGSSAHARVHRGRSRQDSRTRGFFRARAGSPRATSAKAVRAMVLPRTRGFTMQHATKLADQRVLPRTRGFTDRCAGRYRPVQGSSAPARVHPSKDLASVYRLRFFRARAGSPTASPGLVKSASVLPRTRGFTQHPDQLDRLASFFWVLPRTRGFTAAVSVLLFAVDGFSAHARVHRSDSRRRRRACRFFRARAGSLMIDDNLCKRQ